MFILRSASPPKYFMKKSHDVHNDALPSLLPSSSSLSRKRAAACYLKRAAMMLLLLLFVFIPLSFCCMPHTVSFDLPFDNPPGMGWLQQWSHLRHRRWTSDINESKAATTTTNTIIVFPTGSVSLTSSSSTEVVVIPATPIPIVSTSGTLSATSTTILPVQPTTTPVLPTPFPQPLDSSLTRNFTTSACYQFFLNMTNTLPFRSCRPFSLLLQSSSHFVLAQSNITQLNAIVWGTCNPTPGEQQCSANMAWFTDTLRSTCKDDLSNHNQVVTQTLLGLQTYDLMFKAGCLSDPSTSSYCYLDAVYNPDPSDLYFYQLPLGISLSNTTHATCSACTKSLMSLYSGSISANTSDGANAGLSATYEKAAVLVDAKCGKSYAQEHASSRGARTAGLEGNMPWLSAMIFVIAAASLT